MTIELHCKRCGAPFTPGAEAVRAGPPAYWYCPDCESAATQPDVHCEKCGRPLRGPRTICLGCLAGGPVL